MMAGLVKVRFDDLRTGMLVSSGGLKVYEVLTVSKTQAMFMKDGMTACVSDRKEFEAKEWYTVVRRRTRRSHGQDKG